MSNEISIANGVPGLTFSSPVTIEPPCRTPTVSIGSGALSTSDVVISRSLKYEYRKLFSLLTEKY